ADEVTDMWARLIANSTDPERDTTAKKVFVNVLRNLEPLDARILVFLRSQGWLEFANVPGGGFNAERLADELEEKETNIAMSLANLFGLGCIVTETRSTQIGLDLMPGGASLDPRVHYRLS